VTIIAVRSQREYSGQPFELGEEQRRKTVVANAEKNRASEQRNLNECGAPRNGRIPSKKAHRRSWGWAFVEIKSGDWI
jgi:hypothetical protein